MLVDAGTVELTMLVEGSPVVEIIVLVEAATLIEVETVMVEVDVAYAMQVGVGMGYLEEQYETAGVKAARKRT